MPGNINDFLTSFKGDLARPSRFEVYITGERDLTLRCETAELPGKTMVTHDQKFYGTIEKYPYQHSYNDMNLTFIVGDDMYERIFFDDWMDSVGGTQSNFNFNYKDTYVRDVLVTQFDLYGNPSYKVKLINAYPIAVNQLDLDWSTDGHHKLTVVLAYTYWESVPVPFRSSPYTY